MILTSVGELLPGYYIPDCKGFYLKLPSTEGKRHDPHTGLTLPTHLSANGDLKGNKPFKLWPETGVEVELTQPITRCYLKTNYTLPILKQGQPYKVTAISITLAGDVAFIYPTEPQHSKATYRITQELLPNITPILQKIVPIGLVLSKDRIDAIDVHVSTALTPKEWYSIGYKVPYTTDVLPAYSGNRFTVILDFVSSSTIKQTGINVISGGINWKQDYTYSDFQIINQQDYNTAVTNKVLSSPPLHAPNDRQYHLEHIYCNPSIETTVVKQESPNHTVYTPFALLPTLKAGNYQYIVVDDSTYIKHTNPTQVELQNAVIFIKRKPIPVTYKLDIADTHIAPRISTKDTWVYNPKLGIIPLTNNCNTKEFRLQYAKTKLPYNIDTLRELDLSLLEVDSLVNLLQELNTPNNIAATGTHQTYSSMHFSIYNAKLMVAAKLGMAEENFNLELLMERATVHHTLPYGAPKHSYIDLTLARRLFTESPITYLRESTKATINYLMVNQLLDKVTDNLMLDQV